MKRCQEIFEVLFKQKENIAFQILGGGRVLRERISLDPLPGLAPCASDDFSEYFILKAR